MELPDNLNPTPKSETENEKARRFGIPKWLKRYHAQYGRGGVDAIVAMHLQVDVPLLDHGRDRAEAVVRVGPYSSTIPKYNI